jgi:transcriptional regulator with GAF, ATPase, and Fis domain
MRELLRKKREIEVDAGAQGIGLIGSSKHMADIRKKISEIAPLDIPVVVAGESGTGKEVVARCVHEFSPRAKGRFTTVNCAGLPHGLIESELFGHVQGAFTGAAKTKHGYFEVTNGGTLFLDEIGDLPLELQSRLLRVLDRGEYNRVGDTELRRTDVRIVLRPYGHDGKGDVPQGPLLPAAGISNYSFAVTGAKRRHTHACPVFSIR